MPDLDDPRVMRSMSEMGRDMEHLDENNPKHMAHMMRKMKDLLPAGAMPKELDTAIKRLEKGEDPEKIEEDMGDVLGDLLGPEGGAEGGGGGAWFGYDLMQRAAGQAALRQVTIDGGEAEGNGVGGSKPFHSRQ